MRGSPSTHALDAADTRSCQSRSRLPTIAAIVGNRDLDWQDRVSAASKAWVLGLPRIARVGQLLVSHGDARLTAGLSTSQIGRDFVRPWHEMERANAQVWAFGHSHHARTWRKADSAAPAETLP